MNDGFDSGFDKAFMAFRVIVGVFVSLFGWAIIWILWDHGLITELQSGALLFTWAPLAGCIGNRLTGS